MVDVSNALTRSPPQQTEDTPQTHTAKNLRIEFTHTLSTETLLKNLEWLYFNLCVSIYTKDGKQEESEKSEKD